MLLKLSFKTKDDVTQASGTKRKSAEIGWISLNFTLWSNHEEQVEARLNEANSSEP